MFITASKTPQYTPHHQQNTSSVTKNSGSKVITQSHPSRQQSRYLSQHRSNQTLIEWKSRKRSDFSKQNFDFPGQITPQKKWLDVIELYTLTQKMTNSEIQKVNPGISFYNLLLSTYRLENVRLMINFPQTIMMDTEGAYKMIYTDQFGYLKVRGLQKDEYYTMMKKSALKMVEQMKGTLKYRKECDYEQNCNAPAIIIKSSQDSDNLFEIEVESFKTFTQKKPKPTRNKIIQQYIYSRNMKSMIFRYCYDKFQKGKGKIEEYAYRFQNVQPIFKLNPKNDIYQTNKLTSTISLSEKRLNTIQYSKITNIKGLQRFRSPTYQLINFIQQTLHIKIKRLYVDYMVDLFDRIWVINIKFIERQKLSKLIPTIDDKHLGTTGTCRLCNMVFHKNQLNKMLSTKLIHQFQEHLRKRTCIQDKQSIKFLDDINVNVKEHKTCRACECCYQVVIEEIQLTKYQKKFAMITNIKPEDEFTYKIIKEKPHLLSNNLRQWRLMIYIIDLKNICPTKSNNDTFQIEYKLAKGLQQCWKSKLTDNSTLTINKVKIHYFFSETDDIDNFLKDTQILIALTKNNEGSVLANGSSGILSKFKSKFPLQCGQRHTSPVLLFYQQNRKYCELCLKIGLVCDGVYPTNNMNLYRYNDVYFTDSDFTNSNPFPKQWMQIFTVDYKENIPELSYEEIIQSKKNNISKKLMC